MYSSWCQQLAAYRRAIGKPVVCMNVIVNSTEASAPVEHVWSEEELRAGWESFEAALVIWRNEKGYDPRVGDHRTTDHRTTGPVTKLEDRRSEIGERRLQILTA